ncbi:MAG: zinc metallopeptidase [Ruminococcus sp.]|nr:zinc metallopeptidase [Ruminococcus sp.]
MSLIIEIAFLIVLLIILFCYCLCYKLHNEIKNVSNEMNLSGFEIAKHIALNEPHIIKKKGIFLDFYDTKRNVIKLSPEVFDDNSLYATFIAITTSNETHNKSQTFRLLNSFLVLASYFNIIIGSFLNNFILIHFGFALFIIAFIIELRCINLFALDLKDIKPLLKGLKASKILDNLEEYHAEVVILNIRHIATLPYYFINYFR